LHILEGPDGEGSGEVGVHRAGVGVSKGGEAKHFSHGEDLLGWGHVVAFHAGSHVVVGLIVACQGCVGAMMTHVDFIGRRELREMGAD
jgi:hypothetical protein